MKKWYFWTLLISGMFVFASCNNDDEPKGDGNVPQAVLDAFESQYGETRANWSVKDGYAIAQFNDNNGDATAWYALDKGNDAWSMTKTEVQYTSLPQDIVTAISSSPYANWTPDNEVDVLERNNAERLYIIEVNSGGVEVDLCYTESGILVSETVDSDGKENDYTGYLPQTPASGINAWIEQNFPKARIVDVDVERNGTEVEIIHDGMKHEILFDASSNWLRTKTEYDWRNIPDGINTFVQSNHPDYHIDDVDRYETKDNIYYCVELESGDRERKIYLNEQFEEIDRPADSDFNIGGDVQAASGIKNVVNERYPDARIEDIEYDDGRIEVDIRHDGREKEVYFNYKEEWLYTNYDIRSSALPDAVKNALNDRFGAHAYWDEDAECVETPEGTFYEVEVYDEFDVYLSEDGEIKWVED